MPAVDGLPYKEEDGGSNPSGPTIVHTTHEKGMMGPMKVLIAVVVSFLVGCSGAEATDAESSAGGTPAGPDYVVGDTGGWHNPCGRTYKLNVPLPDGGYIVKEMPVYCTIWEGDFGDPPPREVQGWSEYPEPYVLPTPAEQQIK